MRAGQSPDYLNKLQLAERLGVTRRVVEEMTRRRMIPYLALEILIPVDNHFFVFGKPDRPFPAGICT